MTAAEFPPRPGMLPLDPHAWLGTISGVTRLTLLALPLALLVTWVLVDRRRRRGSPTTWAWRTSVAEVGIAVGTAPMVWLTLVPGARAGEVDGRVTLVPLSDVVTMSSVQIIGNLMLFAAVGLLAPLRFTALASIPRIVLLAGACSVLIETAQYALRLDRVTSVDDVLLNTAGAGMAALLSRPWWRARPVRSPSRAPSLVSGPAERSTSRPVSPERV